MTDLGTSQSGAEPEINRPPMSDVEFIKKEAEKIHKTSELTRNTVTALLSGEKSFNAIAKLDKDAQTNIAQSLMSQDFEAFEANIDKFDKVDPRYLMQEILGFSAHKSVEYAYQMLKDGKFGDLVVPLTIALIEHDTRTSPKTDEKGNKLCRIYDNGISPDTIFRGDDLYLVSRAVVDAENGIPVSFVLPKEKPEQEYVQ